MAEVLTLAAPIVRPTVGGFSISRVTLTWEAPVEVRVELVGDDGVERRTFAWTGSEATTMIRALNTLNLSVKSLQKRVFERLVSDGYLDGSIVGAPD